MAAFIDAFRKAAIHADLAVLSGSLPAGTPAGFYRELLTGLKLPTVIDARGPELLAVLPMRPLVVKPNRDELAHTLNRSLETDAKLIDGMRQLNQAGAVWVVVTAGKQPVWMTSADKVLRFETPTVAKVENPIGCGDCMAAGIAYGLSLGKSPADAVALGMAAAAENLAHLLPARLRRAAVFNLADLIRPAAFAAGPADSAHDEIARQGHQSDQRVNVDPLKFGRTRIGGTFVLTDAPVCSDHGTAPFLTQSDRVV